MRIKSTSAIVFLLCLAAGLMSGSVDGRQAAKSGRTYVVDQHTPNAADDNPGTKALPLKTIQAGADRAQPGDTILVQAGIYREEVVPPRGGVSPESPITYQAAPGEVVSIRGSEQITTWLDKGHGVWMVELDTAFFKGFNPFAIPVDGEWMRESSKRRLGDVYCDGKAFRQTLKLKEMQSKPNTWYTDLKFGYANKFHFPEKRQYPNGKIQIWANFGGVNPNTALTEINARATAFFPEKAGLKYIVIDGFDIRHTAPQWADIYTLERGAIGTRYGYRWTIQNCTISDSRNVGISLGVTDEVHFPRKNEGGLLQGGSNIPRMDTIGHHLIRNNTITRCGQVGIYGCYGAVGCVIEGNVITETNYRREWSGANQAAIKILFPIDVIIRDNLVIAAKGIESHVSGIWLDWGAQNARVTGNIIYGHTSKWRWGIFLEVNHGPVIVDNNVLIRSSVMLESDGSVFAHNLMQECTFYLKQVHSRSTPYFEPHSTVRTGRTKTLLKNDSIYNNVFIGGGGFAPFKGTDVSGVAVNHNIYLNGAKPFPDKDADSVVIDSKTNVQFQVDDRAATLKLTLPPAALAGKHPLITARLIGKIPLANMYMEHPDGKPLDITTDYFGNRIDPVKVLPGPFQETGKGENNVVLWPRRGRGKDRKSRK